MFFVIDVDVDQCFDGRRQVVVPVVVDVERSHALREGGRRGVHDAGDAVVLVSSELLMQLLFTLVLGVMEDDCAEERVRQENDHETDVRLD